MITTVQLIKRTDKGIEDAVHCALSSTTSLWRRGVVVVVVCVRVFFFGGGLAPFSEPIGC